MESGLDEVPLAEGWNGAAWTVEATPIVEGGFDGLACPSTSACTAVGDTYEATLVEHMTS